MVFVNSEHCLAVAEHKSAGDIGAADCSRNFGDAEVGRVFRKVVDGHQNNHYHKKKHTPQPTRPLHSYSQHCTLLTHVMNTRAKSLPTSHVSISCWYIYW